MPCCIVKRFILDKSLRISLSVFLVTAPSGCTQNRPTDTNATALRVNNQFAPIVADSILNNRYYYKLISTLGKTRIYYLKDKQDFGPDTVCVYEGDLKNNQAVKDNVDMLYGKTNLKLFRFYPYGVDKEFKGYKYQFSARQSGITVLRQHDRLILFLDQLFSGGGSGGRFELIARKYMIVEDDKAEVTEDYSIITDFLIGYPRQRYGGIVWWSKGRMSYQHCFNHKVSVSQNKLVVRFEKQQFELDSLFESADEVLNYSPNEHWGEHFSYNNFHLPMQVKLHHTRDKQELKLKDLSVR